MSRTARWPGPSTSSHAADQTGGATWPNDAARSHGGGGVRVSFALDRNSGALLIPVGNPAPDFYASVRAGANLFTVSTVALDAKTGSLKWAYQLVQTSTIGTRPRFRCSIQPRNGSCKPIKWYNLLNSLVFTTKISNAEQLTTVQQFQWLTRELPFLGSSFR